jgi:hypothetical protein
MSGYGRGKRLLGVILLASVVFLLGTGWLFLDVVRSSKESVALNHIKSIAGLKFAYTRRTGFPWATHVDSIDFSTCGLSTKELNECLSLLHQFPFLYRLDISHNRFDDESIEHVEKLRQLEWLNLSFSNFESTWIPNVARLSGLDGLALRQTEIDGLNLSSFASMPNLKLLVITETMVDDRSVKALAKLRPNITIIYGAEPFKQLGPGLSAGQPFWTK